MHFLSRLGGLLVLAFSALTVAQSDPGAVIVSVTLNHDGVSVTEQVPAGPAKLAIQNDGTYPTTVQFSWRDGQARLQIDIDPGNLVSLDVHLSADSYEVSARSENMVIGDAKTLIVLGDNQEAQSGSEDTVDNEAFLALGQSVYDSSCMSCHGADGSGGVGVPLTGNDYLADTKYAIEQVVFGGGFMPRFDHLSNEEVAAVVSDIRTSWGNDYGLVTIEEVAQVR